MTIQNKLLASLLILTSSASINLYAQSELLKLYNQELIKINKHIQPQSVHIKIPLEHQNNRIKYWKKYYREFNDSLSYKEKPTAIASGVVLTPNGYIITNNHVVEDSEKDSIFITTTDGVVHLADIVGTDEYTDLAVIRIYTDNLKPIEFGDSDILEVGELTLALGSPLGLSRTLTSGIVSAIGRGEDIIKTKDGKSSMSYFIQTDAAVNPGNSGGGLFNYKGELIGINSSIYSSTGYSIGYGFAIPSTIVKNITKQLMTKGFVNRPYLGIDFDELDEKTAKKFNSPQNKGIVITEVAEKSSASAGGLLKDDIITKCDSKEITNSSDLKNIMIIKHPSDSLTMTIYRNGVLKTLSFVLSEFTTKDLTSDYFSYKPSLNIEVTDKDNKLFIKEVELYGAAYQAGIKEEDIIVSLDNQFISKSQQIKDVLLNKKPGDTIKCKILRKNEEINKDIILHSSK